MKEGWTYKKLGEVCNIDFGTRVVRSRDAGSIYPVYGGGGATFKMDTFNREDCMVISRFGMSEQCTRFVKGKFFLNDSGLTLSMKEECMIQPFMDWEILSLNKTIYSLGRGAAQKNLDTKALADVIISYPTSLSEQRAIVARLDSAFAQIDSLKANAEKQLSEARKLFQKALEEAMTPKEGWEEKKLGDVCDIFGRIGFRGYTTKDLVNSPQDGAISLSPSNIQDGIMDYSKLTYISWFKYEESPEIKIFNGDILLVKTGSSYGKSALVENLPHEATINPQSVVLKNIKIDNKFFAYQLRTDCVREEFNQFVSGTAIPTFSQAKLSTVPVYIPNSSTQHTIVAHLDALSSHVRALEEKLKKMKDECDALKQAMLREVFE